MFNIQIHFIYKFTMYNDILVKMLMIIKKNVFFGRPCFFSNKIQIKQFKTNAKKNNPITKQYKKGHTQWTVLSY